MQITGLLKNFIDHMSYNFHRPRFFYKKVLTMPIAYRDVQLNDKNRAIINRKADEFALELNSRKVHEPSFKSILMYNVWRGMPINGEGVGIANIGVMKS